MSVSADGEPVAAVVQRLGVMLSAGVTPASAWQYLAEIDSSPERVRAVSASVLGGITIADAVLGAAESMGGGRAAGDDSAWRGLAAAWLVATEAGAPLAPTLAALAGALRDLTQTRRDVAIALAAPAATARLVTALPAVGVLFGMALGFDTLGTLFATPLGLACLVSGVLLMLAARAWNRRLLRRAAPSTNTPGLALDLLAIAISGGASLGRATATVDDALERCQLSESGRARADEVLALSARAGIPAAALLRAEAEELRRDARGDGQRRAAALSVTLMLPLGLCILPAFMLLGVAPLMIAVVTSTIGVL